MTKEKIFDSAYKLFAIHGYEGTSLSQIANEVGIKKPSIYAHFKSKEEIFTTILEKNIRSLTLYLNRIVNEVRGKDTETKLSYLLRQLLEYINDSQASRGFWSIVIFFPPSFLIKTIKSNLKILNDKLKIIMEDFIKEGIENKEIKEDDISNIIYSFTCLIQGNFAIMQYDNMQSKKLFNYQRVEKSWEIFWNSIKNDKE